MKAYLVTGQKGTARVVTPFTNKPHEIFRPCSDLLGHIEVKLNIVCKNLTIELGLIFSTFDPFEASRTQNVKINSLRMPECQCQLYD